MKMKKFMLLFIGCLVVHGSVNAMGDYILQTAQDGHAELVRYLLLSGAKVGNAELVRNLLLSGADPNLQDGNCCTPLHYAALENHQEVVRILIDSGRADVNKQDCVGFTPLHNACACLLSISHLPAHAQAAIVNAFYAGRIETNDESTLLTLRNYFKGQDIDSPGAAERHSIVQMLIAAGAMINQKADDGSTPLHHAMKSLALETIQTLIAAGADITITDQKGLTPLNCLIKISSFVLEQPRPDLVNLLNRVKDYPQVAKDQLLALLGAGHSRLGAGSPAQLVFHKHSEVARIIAPFIRKGAFEDALYGIINNKREGV